MLQRKYHFWMSVISIFFGNGSSVEMNVLSVVAVGFRFLPESEAVLSTSSKKLGLLT